MSPQLIQFGCHCVSIQEAGFCCFAEKNVQIRRWADNCTLLNNRLGLRVDYLTIIWLRSVLNFSLINLFIFSHFFLFYIFFPSILSFIAPTQDSMAALVCCTFRILENALNNIKWYDCLHRPNRLGITREILNHWWFHIVEEFHNHQHRLRQCNDSIWSQTLNQFLMNIALGVSRLILLATTYSTFD